MEYELRVIPDCPNGEAALELFHVVLTSEGAVGAVRVLELVNEEQARELAFHGSPSFIAGGRDLFPSAASPALACRVYPGDAGLAGLPTQEELRTAIRSASSRP